MLADPEEVDAGLVGEDALLDDVADRLRLGEPAPVAVVDRVAEGVQPEHQRKPARAASAAMPTAS